MICKLFKLKKSKIILFSVALFLLVIQPLIAFELQAQTVTGNVRDGAGEAIIGANVVQKGTSNGIITDVNGDFSLNVPGNATLVVSYLGYTTKEISVNNQKQLSIQLTESSKALEEVVVVGYGTQKKATVTGAISTVGGSEVVKTVNENAQNMLTGKATGVRVVQSTAEPGSFNTHLDIRGYNVNAGSDALIVIDGIPRTTSEFQRLDPNDIESISVLKDASAAIYGVRSAQGVILVTTKKGEQGTINFNYSGTFTAQHPSGFPSTVDPVGYMTLRNENNMHKINGGSLLYDQNAMNDYLNGTKQGVNWYDAVFSQYAPQTMHTLSASGGNDKVSFYTSVGYEYQDGFFKSQDLNYNKYNIRSNITAKLTSRLKFEMNLSSTIDQQDRPYQDSWWIIRAFWRQNSMIPIYADPAQTMLYQGLIEGNNPVSFMRSDVCGYKKYGNKWFTGTGALTYDIPGIKGLSIKGLINATYYVSDNTFYNKAYNQYQFDQASQTYTTFTLQSPSTIQRQTYMQTDLMGSIMLNYDQTFGKHKVGGVLVWEAQKHSGDNFSAQRQLLLPLDHLFAGQSLNQLATMDAGSGGLYKRATEALAGRVNYGYADKYLIEAQFRYDGSSMFGPGHQWGFFPSISVGWRISEENFFKNTGLSFVNQLKLRASYGILGDDAASAYQFISGYNFPTGSDPRNFTGGYVFNGMFVPSADNKGIPNANITWYKSKTSNAGVDFDGWNGLFGFTLEYFNRDRTGLLAQRTGGIPTVVGAALPQENLNSDRTFGLELELRHNYKVNKDFSYQIKGMASITRNEWLSWEHAPYGSSWSNWLNNQEGRLQGIHSGWQGDGQFASWNDIYNYSLYTNRGVLPGDYKYVDWNGDGIIDGNDTHPISFNQYPWLNFSLTIGAQYKWFDLSMLWQGSALGTVIYGEQLRQPLWGNDNSGAMTQFLDRWHLADPTADPYDPSQTWIPGYYANTGTLPDVNSSFNSVNGAYLRLKSVELGYTLPTIKGIKNLRVFVNAYNILTITKVKYIDPEHTDDTYGYLYPLNKSYSIGLNLKF